jgi:hypothetical protein
MLYFIGEDHSRSEGRLYVKNKLEHGRLNILFIEFPNEDIGGGHMLQTVLAQNVGQPEPTVRSNLADYFRGLGRTDAEPNLKELTVIALTHGVRVFAVDMTVIGENNQLNTAYNNLENDDTLSAVKWDQQSGTNEVEYEKLALRNAYMARTIADNMQAQDVNLEALFLCGNNHFKPSVTQDEIQSHGWPRTKQGVRLSPFWGR